MNNNSQTPITAAQAPPKPIEPDGPFLNSARLNATPLAFSMRSGKTLVGMVESFGRYTILVRAAGNRRVLIHKHAVDSYEPVQGAPAATARAPGTVIRPAAS